MANQNSFNFDAYNHSVRDAGAGLKLFLAIGLMRDVLQTLDRFDNPLADDCRGVVNNMKSFRLMYQEAAKARAEKTNLLMASDGKSE